MSSTSLSPSPGRTAAALGAGIALIYLAFSPPAVYSLDGNSMLALSESIVSRHAITVPSELGVVGRNGSSYSAWYPLLSVMAVPFVAIGLALGALVHAPPHFAAAVLAVSLSALVTAGTAAFVFLLAFRLGCSRRQSVLAAVALAFGTVAMTYARSFFADPLLAFLTIGSLYYAVVGERRGIAAAVTFVGLAVLAKPAGVIVGPILAAYLVLKKRSVYSAVALVVATGVGCTVYGLYNYARFGNALVSGQPFSFSVWSVLSGIPGHMLSPGRGLIWYCPPTVLAVVGFWKLIKTRTAEAVTIAGITIGYVAIYSAWGMWYGGWSWGPRLLVPALPGLLVLAGAAGSRWRPVLLGLTMLGFLISAPTLITFYERYYVEVTELGIPPDQQLWDFAYSPLAMEWGVAGRQIDDAIRSDARELLTQAGSSTAGGQALRVVAVWWWMLPAVRLPQAAGAGVALLFIAAGVRLIVWTLRLSERVAGVPASGLGAGADDDLRSS